MHPFMFAFVISLLLASTAQGEIERAVSDSFVIVFNQTVDAGPAKVYASLIRIDQWWSSDHTYSRDASNLSLSAEAGSCWCERWKDGRVDHGRVILAMRDKLLGEQFSRLVRYIEKGKPAE